MREAFDRRCVMTENSRRRLFLRAIAPLAIALGIYLLTYGLMLDGKVYHMIGVDSKAGVNLFETEPTYRLRGVARLLLPAHELDRVVRRDYWIAIEKKNGVKWEAPISRPNKPMTSPAA
jgi:hypothetical protein